MMGAWWKEQKILTLVIAAATPPYSPSEHPMLLSAAVAFSAPCFTSAAYILCAARISLTGFPVLAFARRSDAGISHK